MNSQRIKDKLKQLTKEKDKNVSFKETIYTIESLINITLLVVN